MIAYKATHNFKCINQHYKVGKTYTADRVKLGRYGLHFSLKMEDTLQFYNFDPSFVLLEVEVLGKTDFNHIKGVTDKLKILRVVPRKHYTKAFKQCLPECEYDEKGRMISLEYSWGKKYIYDWDDQDNHIRETFSSGVVAVYEYDDRKNLISSTHTCAVGKITKTFMEYDERGNMTRHTRDNGKRIKSTSYEYDESNNMTLEINCDGSKYPHDKGAVITESD